MHLVHLLAAYAVLLSNLSSALRDETIRLNLEALLCCPRFALEDFAAHELHVYYHNLSQYTIEYI